MRFSTLALAAAAAGTAYADFIMGFNSGATDDKGAAKSQDDFEKEFKTAQSLNGAPGTFSAIRLYSNIQAGTTDTPIAAFQAAMSTNSKLLLGIWASQTDSIDNELKALSTAVKQYGSKFTDLVIGISVGSEDLYRDGADGIKAKAGVGNGPDNIVKFIKQTRQFLAGTALKNIKVTHVDTWSSWTNGTNKAVIDNIDFVAVNEFPFYETNHDNRIENAAQLFSNALAATKAAAGSKEVWVTETGWAYSGPAFGPATSTVDNAAKYWQDVGCALFGQMNVFWYTLRDANPANQVKFAITDNLSTTARFPLACKDKKSLPAAAGSSNSSSSSNSTSSPSGSVSPNSNGSPTGSGAAPTKTGAAAAIGVNMATMGLAALVAVGVWAM